MTLRRKAAALVQRKRAERRAAASTTGEASTPYRKLLRAAESGRFEALVRKARPAEPLAMVTPQEREAELRASGCWPSDEPASTSPVTRGRPGGGELHARPAAHPHLDPPPSEGGGSDEMTPNEQYLAEHCRWRRRGPHDHAYREPRSCLTDYDPLADEEEGDE